MSVTKQQLVRAMRQWQADYLNGECLDDAYVDSPTWVGEAADYMTELLEQQGVKVVRRQEYGGGG